MPRLSLWRPNKGNDYKFFDRRMSEMFTVGGTDVNIHKYLGPISDGTGTSATEPGFLNDSVKNIQDLLFLENRDRKYDTSIYTMRSLYRMNDNDFDLTQFGLFLTGDTMFMVFHLNDMIDILGRKIIVGDVMELPHLKDYYALDDTLPAALKRYYVVQDATRAAEGFAPTWYPHLWRVKVAPLVDSQEYKDILNNITAGDANNTPIGDLMSTYDKYLEINDAIIQRAEADVPKSGYDSSFIYTAPVSANNPANPTPGNPLDINVSLDTVETSTIATDASASIETPELKVEGYLTGDGLPPNGAAVNAGISFPTSSIVGDFYLRLDYVPNRLFRFDGRRWIKVEDAVRTNLTAGADNKTLRSSFVNNTELLTNSSNTVATDSIRVATPYTPAVNAVTSSFTLSTKTVLTKVPYDIALVVVASLNHNKITATTANTAGNLSFTVSNTLTSGDVLEYSVHAAADTQRQSLSQALRPQADN